MASSGSPSATPLGPISFLQRIQGVEFDRALIKEIIMEYLEVEGFLESASQFSKEAKIQQRMDTTTAQERVEIRNCILAAQIPQAIQKIIALEPQVLEGDADLHFALLRLQAIELIKPAMENPKSEKHLMAAIDFAREQLAPRVPTNSQFKRDYEETMTLIISKPGEVHSSLTYLLEPELKQLVAKRVNEAILRKLGEGPRIRLMDMIRTRQWAENRARKAKKNIPDHIDVGLDPNPTIGDEDSIMESGDNDNDHTYEHDRMLS